MAAGAGEIVSVFENQSLPANAANYGTGTNTSVAVAYTAIPNSCHTITGVVWSYSADPTGGNLLVQDGSNTVFCVDVIHGGGEGLQFIPPIKGTVGNAMTITLAAGGSGIVGRVSVLGHRLE